jgi:hypothetical protein
LAGILLRFFAYMNSVFNSSSGRSAVIGVLASGAAAYLAGVLFDLTIRQQFFPAAFVLGGWLLVLVRRSARAGQAGDGGHTAGQQHPRDTIFALLEKGRTLSERERREWLDAFLAELQE